MAAGFAELVLLLFDWFMLVIIMLLTIRSITAIIPVIKKTPAATTIWYLFVAFGYSLICVTAFTSWVIWFIGGLWGLVTLFLTWFILIYIFLTYKKLGDMLG